MAPILLLRRAAVLSLSVAIATTACSKKKTDGESPADAGRPASSAASPPPEKMLNRGEDFQRACYELGKTRCMQIGKCSQFAALEGTFMSCLTRTVDMCNYELAPLLGTITLDQIKTCTKAQAEAACTMVSQADLSACERPPGTLATGAPCTADAQCSTNHCARAHGAACGKCDAPLAEGAACEDGRCGIGALACIGDKCVRPRDKGEDCEKSDTCKGGLVCKGGKCDGAPAAGASCDPAAADACDSRALLKCDAKTKKCQPRPTAGAGGKCGDATAPPCEGGTTCKNGKCLGHVARGKACSDADPCETPLACVRGACAIPDVEACAK